MLNTRVYIYILTLTILRLRNKISENKSDSSQKFFYIHTNHRIPTVPAETLSSYTYFINKFKTLRSFQRAIKKT